MSANLGNRLSLYAFCQNTTVSLTSFSWPIPLNWLVKRLERERCVKKAGDGTRTRDSLLGRQAFTQDLQNPLSRPGKPIQREISRFERRRHRLSRGFFGASTICFRMFQWAGSLPTLLPIILAFLEMSRGSPKEKFQQAKGYLLSSLSR